MSAQLATFTDASASAVASLSSGESRKLPLPCWRTGMWRCGSTLVTEQAIPVGITWTLAIACACLTIGGAGLSEPIPSVEILQFSGKPGAIAVTDDAEESDAAMVEMTSPSEVEPLTQPMPDMPPEAQEIWQPQELPETPDLPPLVETLDVADLFAVPAAPPIEPALTPLTPRRETPRAEPRPTTASSRPSTSRTATTGSTTQSASGGTGTGKVGSGGKGKFPAPPYPSFARSRRMQGTTYLSIRVNDAGTVESVSVSSSSGYSDLDAYASGWVRKYWRWPSGGARSFRQPFVFRLR